MTTTEEAVLKHYGVAGMKWGKRKGTASVSSPDHTEAQALKKKPVNEMTNAVKQLDSSGSVAWLYSLTNSGTVLHRLMLI